MILASIAPYLAAGLFVGMLLMLEVGRRFGVRRLAFDPEGSTAGAGVIDGAIFTLLGLLIAFTFSGAASRFDGRRQLDAQEANNIGTAYLRLDVLPSDAQIPLRVLFRQYLDSRIETYRKLPDLDAAQKEWARSVRIQGDIWSNAVAICKTDKGERARLLLLPALNQMIDITTTRKTSELTHPPGIIYLMLCAQALVCSLLAGLDMAGGKARNWILTIGFTAALSVTFYVILDLDYPRLGLFRLDTADQMLIDLRGSLN
jgi:hypothetical protein